MGAEIGKLFVDPEQLPNNFGGFVQLLFLMMCYAYFLSTGSHFISDGSELLLLVPSIAGLIGSVVLPVLGAVPDGAIVLFSGMGPDAQEQLNIGVGALAGSTVVLLTIPWALCILTGRVDLDENDNPIYKKPKNAAHGWSKLSTGKGWRHALLHTGITINRAMRVNAIILLLTALAYLIIQLPGFVLGCGVGLNCSRGGEEKWWAFGGFLFAFVSFVSYLAYQVRIGGQEEWNVDRRTEIIGEQLSEGQITVAQAFFAFLHDDEAFAAHAGHPGDTAANRLLLGHEHQSAANLASPVSSASASSPLPGPIAQPDTATARAEKRLKVLLRRFFRRYDRDCNDFIDAYEMQLLLKDLGSNMSIDAVRGMCNSIDKSGDGQIDFPEFVHAMCVVLMKPETVLELEEKARASRVAAGKTVVNGHVLADHASVQGGNGVQLHHVASSVAQKNAESVNVVVDTNAPVAADESGDDEEEEEEEVPQDLMHLDRSAQQRAIKIRAAWMMALGTVLILLFSDPMVDCLNELGARTSIKPFYIAFVLAPLAANFTELLAAIKYASRKTPSSIAISITSLQGSSVMNNSFCLLIFLLLIFVRGLIWQFSAETITILVVEIIMSLMALCLKVHKPIHAIFIFSLYPASIALVAILENVAGLN